MSILFASISKSKSKGGAVLKASSGTSNGDGNQTLLEYSAVQGNFNQITKVIQEKIQAANGISQMSYVYDGYYFHFITLDSIIYLCLTNEEFPRRKAFDFLSKLKLEYIEKVTGQHDDFEKILAFHPVLQGLVHEYSKPDAMQKVQQEVEQVKTIMSQNIEKVLNRGELIDNLVDRTESLQQQSMAFRSSSRSIAKEMWWKDMKVKIVGGSVVGLVVLAIIIYVASSSSK